MNVYDHPIVNKYKKTVNKNMPMSLIVEQAGTVKQAYIKMPPSDISSTHLWLHFTCISRPAEIRQGQIGDRGEDEIPHDRVAVHAVRLHEDLRALPRRVAVRHRDRAGVQSHGNPLREHAGGARGV